MNHRAGLDRAQTLLFPERLEDYVAAENPVRFLDAFVGSLDLHALGFGKARCADAEIKMGADLEGSLLPAPFRGWPAKARRFFWSVTRGSLAMCGWSEATPG